MELSGAARWVINRAGDLAAITVAVAVLGAVAAKIAITCYEWVRRTWVNAPKVEL